MGDCPVCLDTLDSGPTLAIPGCNHELHVACALTNAQYDSRCPICRCEPPGVAPRNDAEIDDDDDDDDDTTIYLMRINSYGEREDHRVDHLDATERRALYERFRREHANARARLRRALRAEPQLAEADRTRRAHERRGVELRRESVRIYEAKCREVWRSDPEIQARRKEWQALRRRELRLKRKLFEATGVMP